MRPCLTIKQAQSEANSSRTSLNLGKAGVIFNVPIPPTNSKCVVLYWLGMGTLFLSSAPGLAAAKDRALVQSTSPARNIGAGKGQTRRLGSHRPHTAPKRPYDSQVPASVTHGAHPWHRPCCFPYSPRSTRLPPQRDGTLVAGPGTA